jgi:hypothetical protein
MKRPFLAGVLATLAFLAPAVATPAPSAASAPSAGVAALPASAVGAGNGTLATVPAALKVDRCASRSKTVKRLKQRYKSAETRRGRARSLRLLNAARRSLKRCRAQKPKPNTDPGPGTSPAPAPSPTPGQSPAPLPLPPTPPPPPPAPEGVRLTVNDGTGGTFGATTTFTIVVTGLPTLPEGQYYRMGIRSPWEGNPRDWRTCQRPADSDPFNATGAAATLAPKTFPRWCKGVGKVIVWSGAMDDRYEMPMPTVASVDINVVD